MLSEIVFIFNIIISLKGSWSRHRLAALHSVQQSDRVLRFLQRLLHLLLDLALPRCQRTAVGRELVLGVNAFDVGVVLTETLYLASSELLLQSLLHTRCPIRLRVVRSAMFLTQLTLRIGLFALLAGLALLPAGFHVLVDKTLELQRSCRFCVVLVADLVGVPLPLHLCLALILLLVNMLRVLRQLAFIGRNNSISIVVPGHVLGRLELSVELDVISILRVILVMIAEKLRVDVGVVVVFLHDLLVFWDVVGQGGDLFGGNVVVVVVDVYAVYVLLDRLSVVVVIVVFIGVGTFLCLFALARLAL